MLSVDALHKTYDDEPVLRGVDLTVQAGTILSILGRSGSGKTTLLRIIAGLDDADTGTVALNGHSLDGQSPRERGIVYLSQEPLLFPHLSVRENVAFGLDLRDLSEDEIDTRTRAMVEALGLSDHIHKRPHQLSGGQKQRVAFGRAAILNPNLLLLDEPFANLDVDIRTQMQDLFQEIAATFGITALFVTHNLKEALLMGDRLAHLRNGVLKMYASRNDFVRDPAVGVQDEMAFWTDLHDRTK